MELFSILIVTITVADVRKWHKKLDLWLGNSSMASSVPGYKIDPIKGLVYLV